MERDEHVCAGQSTKGIEAKASILNENRAINGLSRPLDLVQRHLLNALRLDFNQVDILVDNADVGAGSREHLLNFAELAGVGGDEGDGEGFGGHSCGLDVGG